MGEWFRQSAVRTSARGLANEEARRRLLQCGPNAVTEKKPHLILALFDKF